MSTKLMRTRRRLAFASIVGLVAACGSKTGLLLPEELEGGAPTVEAGPDVIHHIDAKPPPEEDVRAEDVLPPIDVRPPVDVFSDCPDAASTLVYVITEQYNLYSFYPPGGAFTQIGHITCPATGGSSTPFSMAVDRTGIAYVVFNDGELFRVSTATAACQATGFVPGQHGFPSTFGMAFTHDAVGDGETLYVASDATAPQQAALASIDVKTFQLTVVGNFNPQITMAELTGTGAGDLFGFWGPNGNFGNDSAIVQIDKTTAQVTNSSPLPGVSQGSGWAFAFWGGDFYTFTAPSNSSIVTRFRPSDGSVTEVASTNEIIVGAGVSTCAPQQ
jgi:hypothetical protein